MDLTIIFLCALYATGLIIFLINCSVEFINKGQAPGLTVLFVSLCWPLFLLAVLAFVAATRPKS